MARTNMSIPHERRKAKLKSQQLMLRVRQGETKEKLRQVTEEIKAMQPKRRAEGT